MEFTPAFILLLKIGAVCLVNALAGEFVHNWLGIRAWNYYIILVTVGSILLFMAYPELMLDFFLGSKEQSGGN